MVWQVATPTSLYSRDWCSGFDRFLIALPVCLLHSLIDCRS